MQDDESKEEGGEDPNRAGRGRADGRHQILLYMKPDLIRDLKAEALEDDTTAFRLVEKAVIAFLAKRRRKKRPDAS